MVQTPLSLFGSVAERERLQRRADDFVGRANTMMRRARALVLADRAHAATLLTARRVALGAHFRRYQRFKHGSIFDPVVEHGTASSRIVARTMKVDCLHLGEVFGAFHTRWLDMHAAEWSAYREDMLATVDMLTASLDAELRAIRQLLMVSAFYGNAAPVRSPAAAA